MNLRRLSPFVALFLSLAMLPTAAFASVEITEVMYNPEGADSGREWVELKNTGNGAVSLDDWRLRENETDHRISTSSHADYTNSLQLQAGGFIVLADDPQAFAQDFPGVSAVLDSAFTLVNSGEKLAAIDPSDAVSDTLQYDTSIGGDNNGHSLQRHDGSWLAANPTPAAANATEGGQENEADDDTENEDTEDSTDSSDSAVTILQPREEPENERQDNSNDTTSTQNESKDTITVNAGGDVDTVAGVQVHLDGVVTSSDPSLLADHKILWSLGNGDTRQGADIFYAYNHPDEYTATLMAKGGDRTLTDQINVVVSPPEISIASTSPGSDGFVKIANDLSRDVNLAGWHLRTAEGVSTLPDYTIVSARDSLTVSNRGTGFSHVSQAQLLYPDGRVADSYRPDRSDKQDESAESTSSGEIDTDTTTVNEGSGQGSENESNSGRTEDKTQENSATNTNLQELFTTSSQQAAASQANPGSYFWRWAGLLALVVAAGVSVAVAVSRYAVTADTEDKLAETFNINEM